MEIVDKNGNPDKAETSRIVASALEKGLILLTCGTNKNVIRFIAPTIVTEKEIDKAIAIIDEVMN